jgi:hypothetical protein
MYEAFSCIYNIVVSLVLEVNIYLYRRTFVFEWL